MPLDENRKWEGYVPRGISLQKVKGLFGEWLADQNKEEPQREKEGWGISFFKFEDDPRYEKLYDKLIDLARIWADKETGVRYVVGSAGKPDTMVFENDNLGWRKTGRNELAITVRDLNTVLEENGSKMRILRPDESKQSAMKVLHNMRIGSGVFKGTKFSIEYPEESKEEPNVGKKREPREQKEGGVTGKFDLDLVRKALDKYTVDENGRVIDDKAAEIKASVEDFLEIIKYETGKIERFGFEVAKNGNGYMEITGVTLKTRDGQSVTVRADIFRNIFKGVHGFSSNKKHDITGLEFLAKSGGNEQIDGWMGPGVVKSVLEKTTFGGVKLPSDTVYFIGDKSEK